MATRGIDEMYIYGRAAADATPPSSQTYVASVELGSLDEIWRTYLNNAYITNEFYLQGAVYTLADGSLGATAAHQLFKLNATTGAVEAVVTLPTGDNPPGDSGSNGFSAFPGDGTLVLKSFNRPVGCTLARLQRRSLPDLVTNIDDRPLFLIMRTESEISALSSIVMMSLSTKSPIL